ncbi:MAG TPA: hypothetical protein EYP39_08010 [Ghiorsea sp.]|nr:hypothetical protein [Ghiorsea sp.]HIP07269.1 hypothetical protein [Mariprofundaceae bacterium]
MDIPFVSEGDTLLTVMFIIGLFQFFWLSVMITRRGINPSTIRLYMLPLLTIWVLVWPAYENTWMPLLSLALFAFPFLFSLQKDNAFARHLRLCWHTSPEQIRQPTPWLMLIISFIIAALLFQQAPELGLGVGLSFTMAWSAAEIMDKTGYGLRLGLKSNPFQTLLGHLLLLIAVCLVCAWALQLYHGIPMHMFMVATLIAGLVASMIRAIVPQGWNMPLSMLAISLTLGVL